MQIELLSIEKNRPPSQRRPYKNVIRFLFLVLLYVDGAEKSIDFEKEY